MTDPLSPNFKKGVGRLAVDRFDFQEHVDGYRFRHRASSIDLFPTVVISGDGYTNVQSAIEALANFVSPPDIIVQDATVFVKGIVKLAGDIGGTANSVTVTALQNRSVSNVPPSNQQVLSWNSGTSAWTPTTLSSTFLAAGDISGNNLSQTVIGIQGRSVQNVSPSNRQALMWSTSNSRWEPTTFEPTGNGFTTVTSGNFTAASTANIRYTGGKLQTDVNIQFNNVGITGDLAWAPASTNKTLTLPNATDTLVGLATIDTLTNKTVNATNNTITDTSATLGDILAIVSGTKFTRLAKGANGSFLGVSGGILGYYTPSNSTPTGTGFAHVTSGVFDSSATASIRYTGGKFQTDNNIQFKSGSFIGDLSWAPTNTRVLSLPDLTDNLVSRTSTDTLTNKTFDVAGTGNSLTSTAQASGDLLKNDGTKFNRFARGSALQLLRVNSGGTDLEWFTASLATDVAISQSGAGQLNNVVSTSAGNNVVQIRFTGDGANTDILLSGIASGSGVRRICLIPTSGSRLILSQEDSNSSSANRLSFFGASNSQYIVGSDGYCIDVIYDTSAGSGVGRWRPIFNQRGV